MLTEVDLVAGPRPDGSTALETVRASGALAVRRTGAASRGASSPGRASPAGVHLVATAAGPLGGDRVRVRVRVRAGAHLEVRAVAATLALPGRGEGCAQTSLELFVEDGASLLVDLAPVVVAAGADVRATTVVDVRGAGWLDLIEQVQLGRHGEAPGRWSGEVDARRDGRPWLRQRVGIGPGAVLDDALDAPRALLSRLRTDHCSDAATAGEARGCAALLPLGLGGALLEATGADLGAVRLDAALCG